MATQRLGIKANLPLGLRGPQKQPLPTFQAHFSILCHLPHKLHAWFPTWAVPFHTCRPLLLLLPEPGVPSPSYLPGGLASSLKTRLMCHLICVASLLCSCSLDLSFLCALPRFLS